jgi:ABC-type lipoprotein release transport system permease subunit
MKKELKFCIFLIIFGLKNLKRNPRRSVLTILAISLGLASLVFTDGLNEGLKRLMIFSATHTLSGHIQIHLKNFKNNPKPEKHFPFLTFQKLCNFNSIKTYVKALAPRIIFKGLISSAESSQGILVYGIFPQYEKEVSKIDDVIWKGDYLKNLQKNTILIGGRLAKKLKKEVGERVILTSGDVKGNLIQEIFVVKGIFKTGLRQIDEYVVFIPFKIAQKFLNMGNNIHEIAILLKNPADDQKLKKELLKKLGAKYEILTWEEIFPSLASTIRMFDFSIILMSLLLFALVALLIGNTLIMSFQERYFEFGVLLALGTEPFHMWILILSEVAGLCLLSILAGLGIGEILNFYFSLKGIPYTEFQLGGVFISEPIKCVITLRQFWFYPMLLFIFSMLIGCYYARKASLLNPAEVITKTL